jgi:hypothetical protein
MSQNLPSKRPRARLNVEIDADALERLKRLSKARGVSMRVLVEYALALILL